MVETLLMRDDQQQGGIVHRQHRTEQEVQQVDIGALQRDDGDTERERDQEESRERGIFFYFRGARDQARADGNNETRDQTAAGHGKQIEPGKHESDRRAGQDGMRHGIADQAHPAQHQEDADRRRAERKRKSAGQRAAHEFEFQKRADQQVVEHRSGRRLRETAQAAASSWKASHMRRAVSRFSGVNTSAVSPQATDRRASKSVCGKFAFTS